jgi:twitching motility protein PilT
LDAKETINRIISVFPHAEQNRVRMTLSSVLKGVISQRLVPTVDGKRTAAVEILIRTPRIEQLIAENRDVEIPDTIAEGKDLYKSQTFDQGILDLYLSGRITQEDAFAFATSPSDLKLRMEGLTMTIEKSKLGQDDGPKVFREDEYIGLKS